ncbi:MAG TPA: hypothetical protein VNY05_08130 [Candidatus Acidoferrales bacterium]|jgi:alpha-tubulin suppressor-like RCC1 family protein|nr:hypothetical protein [Candidatus Acidoferrales bacterium]
MRKAGILHTGCICAGLAAVLTSVAPRATAQQAGTLWDWGFGLSGQLGNNTTSSSNRPVPVIGLSSVIAIDGGGGHSMALKADGTVWNWGFGLSGQLGNGGNISSNVPVQVTGLSPVIAIADGYDFPDQTGHSLALQADGTVWAWGFNGAGELGNLTNTDSSVPVQVMTALNVPLSGVIAIAAGDASSMALTKDGKVWTWGIGFLGQLGNGFDNPSNVAVPVTGLSKVVAIASGVFHNLALRSDGTVWAWGYGFLGQLGNPAAIIPFADHVNVPVQVMAGLKVPLSSVIAIAGGGFHSLALKKDGTVWTWGLNNFGQLGNTTDTDPITQLSSMPVQVKDGFNVPLSSVVAIAGGQAHSAALKSNGTVWNWGFNALGQLGNGNNIDSSVPVPAGFLNGAVTVAAGEYHTLAVTGIPSSFSTFAAELDIQTALPGSVKLEGSFTLGAASNGIHPLTEPVTVQVGELITIIPAGFFEQSGNGAFHFEGLVVGAKTEASITPLASNRYSFEIEVAVPLPVTTTTVPVGLIIGIDSGTASVRPRIER